jgi:hypothetical protein
MGGSVTIVTRIGAGVPDNIVSISGRRRSLNSTTRVFGLIAWPTSIYSIGTLCISPGVKWPKYRADHSCLVLNLREGGATLPLFHISSLCTEGRNYFYGMKLILIEMVENNY